MAGMSVAIAMPVRTSETTRPAGDWMLLASGAPDVMAEKTTSRPAPYAVVPVPDQETVPLSVAPDAGPVCDMTPVWATLDVEPSLASSVKLPEPVTVVVPEARSRVAPIIANSPAVNTFPLVVTAVEVTVAVPVPDPELDSVPLVSTILSDVTPDSSYSTHAIAAVPVSVEVNAGAASEPAATFVQIATRQCPALVVLFQTSDCLVHPVVPVFWAVAVTLVEAVAVTTATSRCPAVRVWVPFQIPVTGLEVVRLVPDSAAGVPTWVTAMARCSPPGYWLCCALLQPALVTTVTGRPPIDRDGRTGPAVATADNWNATRIAPTYVALAATLLQPSDSAPVPEAL